MSISETSANVQLLEQKFEAFLQATEAQQEDAYVDVMTAVWLCLLRQEQVLTPIHKLGVKQKIGFIQDKDQPEPQWQITSLGNEDGQEAFCAFTSHKYTDKSDLFDSFTQISLARLVIILAESDRDGCLFLNYPEGNFFIPKDIIVQMLDQVSQITDQDLVYLTYHDLHAVGLESPGKFIVLRTSSYEPQDRPSCQKNIRHRRRELEKAGIVKDGQFAADAIFNSPSMAANCITGGIGDKDLWRTYEDRIMPLTYEYKQPIPKYTGTIRLHCDHCGWETSFDARIEPSDALEKKVLKDLLAGAYGQESQLAARALQQTGGAIELSRAPYWCDHCKILELRTKVRLLPDEDLSTSCPAICSKCGHMMGQLKFSELKDQTCPVCGQPLTLQVEKDQ